MSNIFSDPEGFGLTLLGEVDFSDGCYEFDYTAVWRTSDGALVYADDAGCSCPSPFEDTGVNELIVCTPAELQAHLEDQAGRYPASDGPGFRAMEIANLMARVIA